MFATPRWARGLVIAGLAAILIGTLDPLEGSILILAGIALATVGGVLARSRQRRMLYTALALGIVGVGAMWGVSAIGGFGGKTGRSMWWALLLVPYPAAWLIALVATIRSLREKAASDSPGLSPGTAS